MKFVSPENIFIAMITRIVLFFLISLFGLQVVLPQSPNNIIREGNRHFNQENFQEAERSYREALDADPRNPAALFNLGNALYRQGRYEEAVNILEGLAGLNLSDERLADVLHNLGNANMGKQDLQKAIDAYKNSLRIRPDDNDTRHNLTYALRQLQEQEQEQQQDQDDQDQDQDNDDQDQQQQPDDDQQDDQEQQQQPRPDQISPQDAERILDALNQQEQEVQERIDREERQRQPVRPERQW